MSHPWHSIVGELSRLKSGDERRVALRHEFAHYPVERLRGVIREVRLVSQQHDIAISESLRHWRFGQDLPEIDRVAASWRFQRIDCATAFLSHFFSVTSGEAASMIFSRPAISDEEVVRWLLTDWWSEHGVGFFALRYVATHDENPGPS